MDWGSFCIGVVFTCLALASFIAALWPLMRSAEDDRAVLVDVREIECPPPHDWGRELAPVDGAAS